MTPAMLAPLLFAVLAVTTIAQDTKSRAVERTLASLPRSLWFVVPPQQEPKHDEKLGLVVVLPGGTGTRDFLPFVENGLLAQAPPGSVGVMITAVKWRDDQQIVWPTAADKAPDLAYTTEQYVRAVVAEVEKQYSIDPARRVVVAWSSSGAAVHPLMAAKDSPFARAYIAMSIWPKSLRDLAAVKGRRYVLDQSPEDQTTTFANVRDAFAALTKAGAVVRLSTYAGGHGWQDDPLPRFREGLAWLLTDKPAPAPEWPDGKVAAKKAAGKNLLANGGFEQGLQGWGTVDNSKRLKVEVVKDEKNEGKASVHLGKTGGAPLDLLKQELELPAGKTVAASAMVKSKGVANAMIKVWLYDADGKAVADDVDLLRVPADGDWTKSEKSWPRNGAVRAVVQVIMVGAGDLWLDDVVLTVRD